MQRTLLIALTIVAGTQRYSLASVPPVATLLGEQSGLSSLALGLATTLTVVMMAVGSPLAAQLSHRISRERVLALGAAAVVVGCAIRAVPPQSVTLFVGSVVGGLGIAAVGTMIPGIIAERLRRSIGIAVGATTFCLTAVAVLASSLTAPIAARIGPAAAMAVWAIPALLSLIIWLPFTRSTTPAHGRRAHLPWRSGTAWLIAGVMCGQSIAYLLSLAWVAPSFQQSGQAFEAAGFLLGTVTLGNMLGAMSAPMLDRRWQDRRPLFILTLVLTALGAVYLLLGSSAAPFPAMLLFGLGLGGGFGVALALLIDLGSSPVATASLSAMTFLVAYLVGAPTPAIGGWLHDSLGGFGAVWWAVLVVTIAQIPLGLALGPARRGSVSAPAG